MISVFFDFRVYRAFVNTEIKEHGIIFCWFEAQLRWTVNEQKKWRHLIVFNSHSSSDR